ncbi:MAG: hypothetical protein ABIO76_10540 [Ginsengibacter sp.]
MADPDQTTTVEPQGRTLQKELSGQASQYMKDEYGEQTETNPALQKLLLNYEKKHILFNDVCTAKEIKKIYLDLLCSQRTWLIKKNKKIYAG